MRHHALPAAACCLWVASTVFVSSSLAQTPPPSPSPTQTQRGTPAECGLLEEMGSTDLGRAEVARQDLAKRGEAALLPMLRCVIDHTGPKPENLDNIGSDPPRAALLAKELATIARLGKSAVPELTRLVVSGGAEGALASGVLGAIGPDAASAAARLLAATTSEYSLLRVGALNALPRLGAGAIPALITGLSATNSEIRETAAQSIGKVALDPSRSVPALTKALSDSEGSVRDAAAAALGAFGPAAKSAVKNLLDARVGKDIDEYSFGAALALIVTDPATLKPAFQSAQTRTSRRAAKALGQMPKGTSLLLEGLAAKSRAVRLAAVEGLRAPVAGPTAAEPVAALLAGGDAELHKAALIFLSSLGAEANHVLPATLPFISDPDPTVRAVAIQAVEDLATTPEQMMPLIASLSDADSGVQEAAAWALIRHPAGAASAPVLLKLMQAPKSSGYIAAAAASAGRVEAIPPLRQLLISKDAGLRRAAAFGLARLGPKASGATDGLLAAFKADEPGRCDYWIALMEIGASSARALTQARGILGSNGVIACEARRTEFSKKR